MRGRKGYLGIISERDKGLLFPGETQLISKDLLSSRQRIKVSKTQFVKTMLSPTLNLPNSGFSLHHPAFIYIAKLAKWLKYLFLTPILCHFISWLCSLPWALQPLTPSPLRPPNGCRMHSQNFPISLQSEFVDLQNMSVSHSGVI